MPYYRVQALFMAGVLEVLALVLGVFDAIWTQNQGFING